MKKTFKRPDGTEEIIDGTPEEIAAYERSMLDRYPANESKKKPDVLRGKEDVTLDELIRCSDFVRKIFLEELAKNSIKIDFPTNPALNIEACRFCGKYNCNDYHIFYSETVTTSDAALPYSDVTIIKS